ncbi:AI-2E family transporter [Streptomyces sp. BE20]|uniref:AI-2E family transporter n=1 Tax=unclassified Streptomyces TaxID=2593676 RepID=UPI002E782F98|nr:MULTISPECIES: AI-2E family transporter [unclassified Streptomyces]MED7948456.1 AI-2E family transporter [Streptomyces sp. BE303]MEE1826208.1 AI-2E family transporter [Streptomyces sp. BE20]
MPGEPGKPGAQPGEPGERKEGPSGDGSQAERRATERRGPVDVLEARPTDHRRPYLMLPPPIRAAAAWSVAVILLITVASLVVYALVELRAATVPVILALLGTSLLYPVMPWMVRRGVSRSVASGLTCAVLVAAVGGVIALLVNSLVHSAPQIAASLQEAGDRIAAWLGPFGEKIRHALDNAQGETSSLLSTVTDGVLSGLGLATQIVTGAVLALALVFFFLRDGHRTGDAIRSYLPGRTADTVVACAERAFEAMAGFMRGTTLIALIDAFFITVGLLVLSVPGAPGLGALVFMGAYIPFVGAFLSGAVAVLVALAEGGFGTALWALGIVLAVQVIEGNVLQPLIQSRTVELHPATIMVAVVAGAGIAGILGALLAVPICAAVLGVVSVLRGDPNRRARGGRRNGTAPAEVAVPE